MSSWRANFRWYSGVRGRRVRHRPPVSSLGQEKVGTVDAHKIKYTNKDGAVTTFYIDPTTFHVIQVSAVSNNMGQEIEVKSTYSDFQKTDYGIVVPHSIDIDFGGQFAVSSKIQKVDVNQPVDASIFEMKK